MEYQSRFVEFMRESIAAHISLADEIASVLSISKDSAYRRMRCETPFTLDEAIIVCRHFDLDTTELFKISDASINFRYNRLYDVKESFLAYMQNFAPQIEEANRRKGQILFAAEDIPMFHHFGYENISAFKIYYWSKAVLNSSEYSGQKYHYRLIHPEILKAVKTLHEAYNRIHSTEIWTDETINSTLRQIIYFKESGQFQDPKDALLLLDEFEQSMKDLEIKAEKSSKIPGEIKNNFSLYNCEVRIGNNCILLDLGDSRRVFLSHNTFNSLRTKDKAFCEETYNWLQNLVKKSTLISDIGEKQRFIFFKKVEDAISQARSVLS